MSRFSQLLSHVEQLNPQLAADLAREYSAVSERRAFGLNFERHAPETVELPGRPVRTSDKVRFLPERRDGLSAVDRRVWRVVQIDRSGVQPIAELALHVPDDVEEVAELETARRAVQDLVVIAEFRDPIYPGLASTGRVERGGSKPFHTVINSENFHALQTLLYTHEGKIDAIYIDPPYNTGARDWKYNNDYVDGEDLYRHSKWLAFMERRLELAQRLLNPDDSVLIVTIDEKEYLRLGLLLEQTFPEARIAMVSSSINNAGVSRKGTFGRAAEYIFVVQIGASEVQALPLGGEWNPVGRKSKHDILWNPLIRTGTDVLRTDSPNQFYPVFIRGSDEGPVFDSVGEPYFGDEWESLAAPPGCVAVWPIRQNGEEGRWQAGVGALRELIAAGHARLGRWREANTTIYYLKRGERAKVASGIFTVAGARSDGSIITDSAGYEATFIPTDVWRLTSHDAGHHGSNIVSALLGRKFPFPKSLYAVEDVLRFFVKEKPSAIVLDYFAGSGTTAHAVMRLNRQDGGRRQCISVTNNEVSADDQVKLRKLSLRPGDRDWEANGICDYITKPRLAAAITGVSPSGAIVKGDYKFNDEFPMAEGFEENIEFFTLTYQTPRMVAHNRAFNAISPLLWLRAGAVGDRIDQIPDAGWAVADAYGVLFEMDQSRPFLEALGALAHASKAFVVTNDDRAYQAVCAGLPDHVEPVRLYESYLTNFTINVGGRR